MPVMTNQTAPANRERWTWTMDREPTWELRFRSIPGLGIYYLHCGLWSVVFTRPAPRACA
jgi:hypothetical protein